MKIEHLGGADCVTGSCHLLLANGLNLLVDCGAVQGSDSALPMEKWPVDPREIHYLFLTHAHMDHIGRVPRLIDKGFRGEIICTRPTREILFPMLEDAMGFTRRSQREIQMMKKRLDELCWDFEYGVTFDLKNGVSFKLGNAGHILGSCFIRFASHDPAWSVVFSGDLGPPDTPILPDPDIPDPCDLLIMESTYGDRLHRERRERVDRLAGILSRALSDGSRVFVPAFALGRCQELIYEMDRIFSEEALGEKYPDLIRFRVPVFVDSPLGLRLTRIYSELDGFWDAPARRLLAMGDHPMDFDALYAVEDHRAHLRLKEFSGPCVIIAGSGMCTGGRIVDHLAEGLGDRKNDLLFVGYQAMGTPGRDILRHAPKKGGYVRLNGRRVDIRARVHELTGYSAHADQQNLIDWVHAMEKPPGKIRLVHGDDHARQTLARKLGC